MSVLGGVKLKDAVKFYINHTMLNGVQQSSTGKASSVGKQKKMKSKEASNLLRHA